MSGSKGDWTGKTAFAAIPVIINLGGSNMCYQNGKKILPPPLLSAIQEYIDGEYIYIPRKTNNKRPWGSTKGTKQQTAERNQEIFCRYLSGIPVTVLAEE